MKVLIAIDSFKGSLSSMEAAAAIKEGILLASENIDVNIRPLADGGEGTATALTMGMQGKTEAVTVTGPLGDPVSASYGILHKKTAIIEMASAAGITLVPYKKRNPLHTTTFGVGEMIADALQKGCRHFIIGIGGSATNDCGVGMLQALGCHFYKKDGIEIGFGATELKDLETIDTEVLDKRLKECTFEIACDVTNSLCGTTGASAVFAPQKGADETMVVKLDAALAHFADVTEKALGVDNRNMPGAGAAGGLGFAFASYLGGDLRPGVEIVLDAVLPEKELSEADIVVTGEGRFDGQTAMGKAPVGIAKRVKEKGCMVLVFAGSIEPQGVRKVQDEMQLVDGAFPILPGVMTLEEAMQKTVAYENMSYTAEQVFRLIGNCYIK